MESAAFFEVGLLILAVVASIRMATTEYRHAVVNRRAVESLRRIVNGSWPTAQPGIGEGE